MDYRPDLRLIEYFVTVAEELHFGRAAARLHVAQPSLSHQIRRLEQQLGVTLLNRTSRKVELTPAGEVLLADGRRLLRQARRTVEAVRSTSSAKVTVGFSGSAAGVLLPAVLSAFADVHPGVAVDIRELRLNEVEDEVARGKVDVAFARLLPDQTDLQVDVVADEPRVVALPRGHSLARREALRYRDLRHEGFITNPFIAEGHPPERWLREQRRHGLPGRVEAEAASIAEILALVASGRGVCLLPMRVASDYPRDDIAYVAVADAEPAVVSLVWSPDNRRVELVALLAIARETAASSDAGVYSPAATAMVRPASGT